MFILFFGIFVLAPLAEPVGKYIGLWISGYVPPKTVKSDVVGTLQEEKTEGNGVQKVADSEFVGTIGNLKTGRNKPK